MSHGVFRGKEQAMNDAAVSDHRPLDALDQLSRLAGLSQVISAAAVQQVLCECERINERACVLSFEVTTWVRLAMGVLTDLPIRSVYQHARRLWPGDPVPTRGALCLARQRLG